MDGVSSLKIRSYNDEQLNEKINKNVPKTYLDKLYQKGFSAKYCYGFDSTQGSFYSFMTGLNHAHSRVSIARNSNLMDYDKEATIPSLFKKKGFRTHYFSNNYMHNPAVITDGFSRVVHDFENYDLSKLRIKEDFDDYFGAGDNNKNIFLTVHDFYTHDQNAQYSKGKYSLTMQEYDKLIYEHADLLENNLKAIKFDEKKDYLFLVSDHGMTVDSDVFRNKGNDESLWSLNSKELKARVVVNIIGPDIEKYELTSPCTLREVFYTFVDKFELSGSLNRKNLSLLRRPGQNSVFTINAGNAAINRPSRITFHQFMCITDNREKYIYQDNIGKKAEYYDLKIDLKETTPSLVSYPNMPAEFREYIESYQGTRRFTIRHIIAFISQFANKGAILFILFNFRKIPKYVISAIRR